VPPRDPRAILPLNDMLFYILLSLADGERHGYAILKEVEASRDATIKLGPTTLYRHIGQMLADGLIAETGRRDDDDARRRYYALTKWGRRVAEAETKRLMELTRIARRVLALAP
jgi:DNA-binding PadR family transcriptional regulator